MDELTDKEINDKYKEFWSLTDDPSWGKNDATFYDALAHEILFHLKPSKDDVLIDTGCGDAELDIRFAAHVKQVEAIDYSDKMIAAAELKVKERGVNNITLRHLDLLNVDTITNSQVDHIINNGVLQYISPKDLDDLISKFIQATNDAGQIGFFNVPNIQCRELYVLGFYRPQNIVTFKNVIKAYKKLRFSIFKTKLKDPKFKFDSGLGFWHSIKDMHELALKHDLGLGLYNSMDINYGYRFHAIFRKRS